MGPQPLPNKRTKRPANWPVIHAAGLFDARALIAIDSDRERELGLRLRLDSHLGVGRSLYDHFGGAIEQLRRGDKTTWRWSAVGEVAGSVLSALWPFLVMKRNQAWIGLSFQDAVRQSGGRSLSEVDRTVRRTLLGLMKRLGQRRAMENLPPTPAFPRDIAVAYLAGLFDARGSVTICTIRARKYKDGRDGREYSRPERKELQISLALPSVEAVELVQQTFPAIVVTRTVRHGLYYQWTAVAAKAAAALGALEPYLLYRRAEATACLLWHLNRQEGDDPTSRLTALRERVRRG